MSTQLARLIDSIPLVSTTSERDQRFPSPTIGQRVQNLETTTLERFTAGGWIADTFGVGTLPSLTVNPGPLIVGTDPGGTKIVRIGGAFEAKASAGGEAGFSRVYANADIFVGFGVESQNDASGNWVELSVVDYGLGQPYIFLGDARGTKASPLGTQSSDILGSVYFGGWVPSPTSAFFSPVELRVTATQTYAAGAAGARLDIFTTPDSTTAPAQRVRIDQNGDVILGSDPGGAQKLRVGGGGLFNGALQVISPQTAATPDYTFQGDTDTGVYQVGLNRLGFATAGAGRWEIDANGMIAPLAANLDIATSGGTRVRNIYLISTGGLRIAGTQDTVYAASAISFGTSAIVSIDALIGTSNMRLRSADFITLQADGAGGPQAIWDSVAAGIGSWQPLTTLTMDLGVSNKVIRNAYVQNFIGGIRKTFEEWWQDNVAASQSAVALTRFGAGTAFPTKALMAHPGSLLTVWVKSSEARTAGTLTVEVYKNGVATGLTAVLDATNTTYKLTTQAADTDTHVAGDEYDIRITTDASWAPTTADVRAGLEVEE